MIKHVRVTLCVVLTAVMANSAGSTSGDEKRVQGKEAVSSAEARRNEAREQASRRLAERAFPGKPIEAFRQVPGLPFYEIWIDRTLLYTDLDARVLLIGNMLDGVTLSNLRQERVNELMGVPFKDLPLDHAIKTVRGRGQNTMVVFADPNCGYCKGFEKELKTLDNVTIYTVMYPVLSDDSREKARAVLCAPRPELVWRAWMDAGQPPPAAADSCQPPLDQVLAFGRKHDISVTPTSFLHDGRRLAGFMPGATLKAELAKTRR